MCQAADFGGRGFDPNVVANFTLHQARLFASSEETVGGYKNYSSWKELKAARTVKPATDAAKEERRESYREDQERMARKRGAR